jgi:glycosyltransferase 2 family protein
MPPESTPPGAAHARSETHRANTSWLRRHATSVGLSLLVAAAFAWVLHAGALPVVPDVESLSRVEPSALVVHALIYLSALYVRAHRWHWLLAPIHAVPLRRVISVSFVSFAALVLLPFRTGEAVRPLMIRRRGEVSGWAATGTVGAERIIDGVVLSLLLLVALRTATPLDPLPDRIGDLPVPAAIVPQLAYAALVAFALAFAVMGAFYFWRDATRRMTERVVGVVSPRLALALADAVERLASGLGFLPQPRYLARFVGATLLYFLLYALAVQVLLRGSGFGSLGFAEACVVMGVLHLGVLLPNAPGYFGAFQISVYAGLAMYYPPEVVAGPGAAAVFWLYVWQIGLAILLGAVFLLVERISPGEVVAEE